LNLEKGWNKFGRAEALERLTGGAGFPWQWPSTARSKDQPETFPKRDRELSKAQ